MKFSLGLFSILFVFSALAQTDTTLSNGHLAYYGENFYKNILPAQTIEPDELFEILEAGHKSVKSSYDKIQKNCGGDCYSHSSVGYSRARLIMFGETFKQSDRNGMFVTDVYCGKKFYFKNVGDVSRMHTEINIEHTWPQSKFTGKFDKEQQKSDMHHLYPTDSDANNRRANHEFADTAGRVDELNVQDCEISQLAHMNGDMKFTPPKSHQGNVARSLFYFSVRYQIPMGKDQEATMRKWHKEDPIDADERARHEIVAKYQKVRNPFIDYPELADKIQDF
ncbi:MAG: endonuclease I family protein [Bacteriovoracaceae bacterium]